MLNEDKTYEAEAKPLRPRLRTNFEAEAKAEDNFLSP